MKTKIVNKKENQLFKREEATIELEYAGQATPNRQTAMEEAAKVLKADKELVSVRKISPVFGKNKSIVTVFVYKDRKMLEKNEPKYVLKRYAPEKKAEEAAPKQA